ncbi:MAG TPA: diadenylate cyclase CdaA [Candidatus Marinimicrobia bacterium]|mgnify:FL=1|nr:diadenylate cyclase CdaA [Candidatus Neomarinimicrobiota bacterium]HQE94642.1 diadenylate cyclase CdaA [Candidatus Neomarinimicrobiota bacterium]HQH54962.1 diadenylate cyclase CdaA [Candidatus Neomarinimicrobiota bacterium]HQK10624.1 diadenylate cyclase CdaA [Candidatus Neomarinimicrobiota bacterium]
MTLFTIKFLSVTIWDVIDIIVVYIIILKLYQFFKGSRASQMLIGLAIILLTSFIARALNLQSLSWIMGNLQTIWAIAFVIIFQPELRRILIYLGQSRFVRRFLSESKSKTIEAVIEASRELVRRKWGGLFVLVREVGLKPIKERATPINAEVSASLLVSIFNPGSPLHDGAVLIQNDIIEAAGCILPLSDSPDLDPQMGTRHRAALGISEESDAVVVVVSEETQKIAVAYQGILYRNVDEDSLRALLSRLFFRGSNNS